MTRIKRIESFITEYKTKTPYLQSICKDSYDHYTKELGREYLKINNHPYLNEYADINDINSDIRHDLRTAELW